MKKLYLNFILLSFLIVPIYGQSKFDSFLEQDNANLMKQIFRNFDLSSIRSSLGPRITNKSKLLSDFYPIDSIIIDSNKIIIKNEYWFYNFELKERGDFNNDGIEDIKIIMTDKALEGTYFAVSEEILTKLANDSKIIGISSKIILKK